MYKKKRILSHYYYQRLVQRVFICHSTHRFAQWNALFVIPVIHPSQYYQVKYYKVKKEEVEL